MGAAGCAFILRSSSAFTLSENLMSRAVASTSGFSAATLSRSLCSAALTSFACCCSRLVWSNKGHCPSFPPRLGSLKWA